MAGTLMHRFNETSILDSNEMMQEYLHQNLKRNKIVEEAQNLMYKNKYGYREIDIPGSLAYTIANNQYEDFSISLIKPEFNEIALSSALSLSFEQQRSILLVSRMLWYGEILHWMKQFKRFDCILCNPSSIKNNLPQLDSVLAKCQEFSKQSTEPKLLANNILNHFEYYTNFCDRDHVRVLLPKEKLASVIREIYSILEKTLEGESAEEENSDSENESDTNEVQEREDMILRLAKKDILVPGGNLDKTQLETYAMLTAFNIESFEL